MPVKWNAENEQKLLVCFANSIQPRDIKANASLLAIMIPGASESGIRQHIGILRRKYDSLLSAAAAAAAASEAEPDPPAANGANINRAGAPTSEPTGRSLERSAGGDVKVEGGPIIRNAGSGKRAYEIIDLNDDDDDGSDGDGDRDADQKVKVKVEDSDTTIVGSMLKKKSKSKHKKQKHNHAHEEPRSSKKVQGDTQVDAPAALAHRAASPMLASSMHQPVFRNLPSGTRDRLGITTVFSGASASVTPTAHQTPTFAATGSLKKDQNPNANPKVDRIHNPSNSIHPMINAEPSSNSRIKPPTNNTIPSSSTNTISDPLHDPKHHESDLGSEDESEPGPGTEVKGLARYFAPSGPSKPSTPATSTKNRAKGRARQYTRSRTSNCVWEAAAREVQRGWDYYQGGGMWEFSTTEQGKREWERVQRERVEMADLWQLRTTDEGRKEWQRIQLEKQEKRMR